jgi:hypothetical protein
LYRDTESTVRNNAVGFNPGGSAHRTLIQDALIKQARRLNHKHWPIEILAYPNLTKALLSLIDEVAVLIIHTTETRNGSRRH